jgi:hypothetical protein
VFSAAGSACQRGAGSLERLRVLLLLREAEEAHELSVSPCCLRCLCGRRAHGEPRAGTVHCSACQSVCPLAGEAVKPFVWLAFRGSAEWVPLSNQSSEPWHSALRLFSTACFFLHTPPSIPHPPHHPRAAAPIPTLARPVQQSSRSGETARSPPHRLLW